MKQSSAVVDLGTYLAMHASGTMYLYIYVFHSQLVAALCLSAHLHLRAPPKACCLLATVQWGCTRASVCMQPSGDVQRNEGKESWGMGVNFKFPWQKKKEKEDQDKKDRAVKAKK